ncbi:MAG TPA: hypothetical protein VF263_07245 [Longimicrobiaceae bacterium]
MEEEHAPGPGKGRAGAGRTRYLGGMKRTLLLLLLACAAPGCRAPGRGADPAAHPPGAVRDALADPGRRWVSADTPHFHLHAPRGSHAAPRLRRLGAEAERARSAGLALLGARDGPRMELVFVDGRAEMARYVGRPVGGMGIVEQDAAFFVHDPAHGAALRHEVMHVLSWRIWGPAWDRVLSEGVATYAAGHCRGHGFHDLAAALRRDGKWVSLEELDERFGGVDDLASYLLGASLVGYVRERWGMAAVRGLWTRGLGRSGEVVGMDREALEAGWKRHLDREASPVPAGWEAAVRARGCE